ncbi:MAG: DNA polymerase domain-containing protein [Nitrososphaerales archaeon]
MVEGWILDLHPNPKQGGEMIVWLKQRNGQATSLIDKWSPSIYVSADSKEDFDSVLRNPEVRLLISDHGFEYKIAEITEKEPKNVLRLTPKHPRDMIKLAKSIFNSSPYGRYEIYNADIDPAQIYMYEHDLFPLAYVKADVCNDSILWKMLDSIESTDYELPSFTKLHLRVKHNKRNLLVSIIDPIQSIEMVSDNGRFVIDGSEERILLSAVQEVQRLDPDIVFTNDGDAFLVPSLLERARVKGLSEKMAFGRDGQALALPWRRGSIYFSYGKVIYKPRPARFLGRIHIDTANAFVYAECGLEGVIEVARTCRVPLDTTARASIGRIMTSIEFYYAYRDGILIPWKPTLAERFKNGWDLMVGDRGGFIFEPKVGVHDNVGGIDFSSLYPTLMFKNNISAETIGCDCCPDSSIRVPELDYNICEKRVGIISKALDLLLQKRARYKELKKSVQDKDTRIVYDRRQNALKWVLVSCFGYLGFRNAKFGRIDAHMTVCAFARKALFDAVKIAENNAYEIIHGIVDSLWLKKRNAEEEDYIELCSLIKEATELPISFEGVYKWIAFLPSKMYDGLPVINRYFGVFKNGEIKTRGIEARKHDTPEFIRRCQLEMLKILAKYPNSDQVKEHLMEAVKVLAKYLKLLEDRQVSIEDLVINKRLSKSASDYKKDILQAIVSKQLANDGRELVAGQVISYIITDFYNKNPEKRALHIDLLRDNSEYDVRKYSKMLIDSANTILTPFGLVDPLQSKLYPHKSSWRR